MKTLDIVQQSLYSLSSYSGCSVAGSVFFRGLCLTQSNLIRFSNADRASGDVRQGPSVLEKRFAAAGEKLNPSRRKLLRLILENPEDTFFLSSRELAKRYAVDAATIVRTIQALGYKKYAEFSADLRAHFVTQITPYAVLKAASKEKRSVTDRIRQGMEMDLRNLQALQSSLNPEKVIALSRQVKGARRILIVGIDLAAALSWHLGYGLMTLGFNAEAPVGSTGNVQRRVRSLTRQDLLIAISFGQCLRDTVEAALRAKKLGVPTFGITDSETSPIAKICDQSCLASVASPSFGGSYVAPLSLLGTILIACAHTQTARSLELLRRSEEEDRADHRWYRSPGNGNESVE
ncbi:MAG TPA: MurR/RpiR family transcriptional regulator [Candidatus Acidoferrum sp.]